MSASSAQTLGDFRVSALSSRGDTPFELTPDADARAAIAAELELLNLRKLRFAGTIAPEGKQGWRLEGMLGATVVQPCVVTLQPVTTRIDAAVTRRFLPESLIPLPEEAEIEMPEDDTLEPLPDVISAGRVMIEALALNLPDYPRADDAVFEATNLAAPGVAPLQDSDLKPFAGLKGLRDKLGGTDQDSAAQPTKDTDEAD